MAYHATAEQEILTEEQVQQVLTEARLKELTARGVRAAYADHEFADDFGYPSPERLRRSTISALMQDPVMDRHERIVKAQTAYALTQRLFPRVAAPGTDEYEEGGVLAERVWDALESAVWRTTDPKANSSGQRLVAKLAPEDGYVLARTDIPVGEGMNATMAKAAYVTKDWDSLKRDYAKPLREKINKVVEAAARDLAMVAERNPELAEQITREINGAMKVASDLARTRLALTTGDEKP